MLFFKLALLAALIAALMWQTAVLVRTGKALAKGVTPDKLTAHYHAIARNGMLIMFTLADVKWLHLKGISRSLIVANDELAAVFALMLIATILYFDGRRFPGKHRIIVRLAGVLELALILLGAAMLLQGFGLI